MTAPTSDPIGVSLVHGIALAEEAEIGALTLGGYLREVTSQFGPNEAACMPCGEIMIRWSYRDLWEKSLAVAKTLLAAGVGSGTRVGVLITNRLEFLSCVFGTALAGGVPVTLSTFSTKTELKLLLEASACSMLLIERRVLKKDFARMLIDLEPAITDAAPGKLMSLAFPYLRTIAMVDDQTSVGAINGWDAFLAHGDGVESALVKAAMDNVHPSDPGILFFSSGSTGKPKGILSSHRGVCLQLWRWRTWLQVEDDVRCWSANGFFWSGNFAMALGATLSSGGALVLQPSFQAEAALALMEAERVTLLRAWPHQWAQLEAAPNWGKVNLSSLRYVDCESPIGRHPSVSTTWHDPNQAYGNTETFTLITVSGVGTAEEKMGSGHGVPTAGSTVKIVDPLSDHIVPRGERGEIAVKGPTLMLGYLGVPLDETLDGEGYLRTGDGGFIDDLGHLHWEGRLNDIIKTGGANVSPVEIDGVVRKCPGVKLAQTVGIPDELLGELVVTCIVPHDGIPLDEAAVRSFAAQTLASYKVPRRVIFLSEEDVTLTGSAKIKAGDLRNLASARLADALERQA
ncbi:AMP-binding protein [Sphingobium sufflavum]|uniref:class I adenylate-forming enzyme family protein n=1 Tax=Sphingobium sufflavum TaxID=1129547 RepID=UPI001F3EF403|nr:AMP-binding protein [Sphingobium sufflavum]MCE7798858.1 AMP-binding protein [Sphingobium sufflavum]